MSYKSPYFWGTILIVLSVFTRFVNLNWGGGYYFHPDENNMAMSVLQMTRNDLNPHFFAYGQFPLFLTFFTTPKHELSSIIMTLRFWSAVFSSLSIFFFYLIIKNFFKSKRIIFLSTLLFIFTPGLIQLAHFGTTESILILTFLINIYLSLKIFNNFKIKYLLFSGLTTGIALATKISSLIFTAPIFLSLLFLFFKDKKPLKLLSSSIIFLLLTLLIFTFFSPFNIIDFASFKSTMTYEIGVATGKIAVFYTRQFINTIPYVFQFQKIFPYTIGVTILVFSAIGLVSIIKNFFKKSNLNHSLLLVLFPVLVFFLYQGQLFVKWTRFMSPVFFIFPFLAGFFLSKVKNKYFLFSLSFLAILPGIFFLKTYFYSDIRVQASEWMIQNIPSGSQILSESGNVVNLPLTTSNFQITNFDFYKLDDSSKLISQLNSLIEDTDYILIPSRRVFKNQNNSNFPQSQTYYQNLFSGKFEFSEMKFFSLNNSLLLNSENAEETWSVFDNPTIRIYQHQNDQK